REWLGIRAERVVDAIRKVDPAAAADTLGEAAGEDRRRGEGLARRLVPRAAAFALAAGKMVHERHAPAVGGLGDDLVSEDGARGRVPELLDVGAAKAASSHPQRLAVRLRDVGQLG